MKLESDDLERALAWLRAQNPSRCIDTRHPEVRSLACEFAAARPPFRIGQRVTLGSGVLVEHRGKRGIVSDVKPGPSGGQVEVRIRNEPSRWFYAYDCNPEADAHSEPDVCCEEAWCPRHGNIGERT